MASPSTFLPSLYNRCGILSGGWRCPGDGERNGTPPAEVATGDRRKLITTSVNEPRGILWVWFGILVGGE